MSRRPLYLLSNRQKRRIVKNNINCVTTSQVLKVPEQESDSQLYPSIELTEQLITKNVPPVNILNIHSPCGSAFVNNNNHSDKEKNLILSISRDWS